jgi:hypothetical protein
MGCAGIGSTADGGEVTVSAGVGDAAGGTANASSAVGALTAIAHGTLRVTASVPFAKVKTYAPLAGQPDSNPTGAVVAVKFGR